MSRRSWSVGKQHFRRGKTICGCLEGETVCASEGCEEHRAVGRDGFKMTGVSGLSPADILERGMIGRGRWVGWAEDLEEVESSSRWVSPRDTF